MWNQGSLYKGMRSLLYISLKQKHTFSKYHKYQCKLSICLLMIYNKHSYKSS